MEDNHQNLKETDDPPKQPEKGKKKKDYKGQKKKPLVPKWLSWGLFILLLSFGLTVIFSFLTEVAISDTPAAVCVVVLLVLLFLNIGCDLIANAIICCDPSAFHSMASNKIRGAKRAVRFCKNASKLGSIFADVIGDICGIVSGAAGTALVVHIALSGDDISKLITSILVSAVIGALTVGGKAIFKHFAIKYNKQIVFGFAKFTTFFKREK